LRYEQGQLDEAEAWVIDRLPLISSGAMLDCVWSTYFVISRVATARMNFERARTLLERAENLGVARGWGRLSAGVIAEQARLHVNDGRLDEAAACVDRLERLARMYRGAKAFAPGRKLSGAQVGARTFAQGVPGDRRRRRLHRAGHRFTWRPRLLRYHASREPSPTSRDAEIFSALQQGAARSKFIRAVATLEITK